MASVSSTRVGWIGLGSMGLAMAKNIQRSLNSRNETPLNYFNRTASRGAPLKELGGSECASIADLVRKSDLIFISTSDDKALKSIIDQCLLAGELRGKVIVDTTTVHPDTTVRVVAKFDQASALFASAPVFGATPMAEEGKLLVAFAGPEKAFAVVQPYLHGIIARGVLRVGDKPEKGTLLKTCGNFMVAGIMEIVAEAQVFAEKTGLGTNVVESLIEENFGALAYSDSTRMTRGVYKPGKGQAPWSDLNLALKDVGHGVSCAEKAGAKLKVGELVLGHLQKAKEYSVQNGDCALDSSSMYGVLREEAGLDFETEQVKKRDSGT